VLRGSFSIRISYGWHSLRRIPLPFPGSAAHNSSTQRAQQKPLFLLAVLTLSI
jgi:hypothetical protein